MSPMVHVNKPIEKKVIFLMVMLMGLCSVLLGLEEFHRYFTNRIEASLINQESRGHIGKALLHRLLLIQKKCAFLPSTQETRNVEIAVRQIGDDLAIMNNGLKVLRQGGSFENTLTVSQEEIHSFRETIIYHPVKPSQDSIEAIDLSYRLADLGRLAGHLSQVVENKLQGGIPASGTAQPSVILLLRRQLDDQMARCWKLANIIAYDAYMQIRQMKEIKEKDGLCFDLIRYGVSAAVLAVALIMCLRTLKQIGRIISVKETYARYLHENSQSVHQILEAMPVGIVLIDPDHNIRQINKTALDLMQAEDRCDLIGQSCKDNFCSIEVENCPLTPGQANTFSNETYLKGKKGINPFVLRKVTAVTYNGSPMVLETFVDISERKQAEQALIEKQNFINKVLEAATVGIVVVDSTDFSIVEANPAAVQMMDAPRATIIGSHWHQWICLQNAVSCPVTSLGQSVDNIECEIITPEGARIPVVKNVAMVLLNDRMHLVESFIDITLLKTAEEKVKSINAELEQRVIQRTGQLEIANLDLKAAMKDLQETQSRLLQSEKMASIGQLAAGVAHEINNPVGFVKCNLNAIDGYGRDLMRLLSAYETLADYLNTSGSDDETLRLYLSQSEAIKDEIDLSYIIKDFKNVVAESDEGLMRVAKIVADLTNFAHLEADETEWIDLNAGIESTLNIVRNELKYKAEVTRELGALPLVRCYPQRINQVIMNILFNAGQAIADKGHISIKTSAANGHVTIAVSDDGQGIQPEHLNKIFDPFFTTKEVGKGTGLGLSVVYNIVKSHKGSIDVDSRVGRGTTFTIRFPIGSQFDENSKVQASHQM